MCEQRVLNNSTDSMHTHSQKTLPAHPVPCSEILVIPDSQPAPKISGGLDTVNVVPHIDHQEVLLDGDTFATDTSHVSVEPAQKELKLLGSVPDENNSYCVSMDTVSCEHDKSSDVTPCPVPALDHATHDVAPVVSADIDTSLSSSQPTNTCKNEMVDNNDRYSHSEPIFGDECKYYLLHENNFSC